MVADTSKPPGQGNERRTQLIEVTVGSLGVFVLLLGAYLLVLRLFQTMQVATGTTLAWMALVVVLALAALVRHAAVPDKLVAPARQHDWRRIVCEHVVVRPGPSAQPEADRTAFVQ